MPDALSTLLDPSPSDAVSRVAFAPASDHVAVATWAGTLSLHSSASGHLTHEVRHTSALLDACYLPGGGLAAAALDGSVLHAAPREAALAAPTALGAHAAAARALAALPDGRALSGGWDARVRAWDPRAPVPAAGAADAGGKVFGMCPCGGNAVALITSAKRLRVLDARKMTDPLHDRVPGGLAFQLRGVSASPDGTQVVVGSTEGRVAVEMLEGGGEGSFSFKCHRMDGLAFPVNCIRHNRKYGSFATAGGDGHVAFWDGAARKRIAQYERYPTSVSSVDFDAESKHIAIAVSYTFEEGEKDHPPDEVHIRGIEDAHVATNQVEPVVKSDN